MKKYLLLTFSFFVFIHKSLFASQELSDFQKRIPNRVRQYIFTFLGNEYEQKKYRIICKNWYRLINDNLKLINRDKIIIRKNEELFAFLQNDKQKLKYIIGSKDPSEITFFIIEKLPEIFKLTAIPDLIKLKNSNLSEAISCFPNLKSFIIFPNWFCRNYKYDSQRPQLYQINFKKIIINQMLVDCIKTVKSLTHIDMPFFLRPSIAGNYYNLLREYIRVLATHPKLETVALPIQFTDIAVFWAVLHNMSLQNEAKEIVLKRIKILKIEEFFSFKDVLMFPPYEFINSTRRDWKKYLSPFKYTEKISLNYSPREIEKLGVSNLFEELFIHHKIRELVLFHQNATENDWQNIENLLDTLKNEGYELEISHSENDN